jgi:ferredoxin-thioredoxin reductase catalytic subunit
MKSYQEISSDAIDRLYLRLFDEAEKSGYHLNPDSVFTKQLVRGLIINQNRYGYWACPCRLASSVKADDLDIICPCDYRDIDLTEYDACYCGLYVSERILSGIVEVKPIPERRPPEEERSLQRSVSLESPLMPRLSLPVWRCKVCGYLCAREQAPEMCPICRAKKERFEKFM